MTGAVKTAYDEIRKRILAGEFEPGSHLSEQNLCEISGVSRTPVREALRRLQSEYFVLIEPNRGASVVDWGSEDISDVFELRAMLEGFAARKAAMRASEAQIAKLFNICKELDGVLKRQESDHLEKFLSLNREFHGAICEASRSARLTGMISRLVEQAVLVRTATQYSYEELVRSNQFHHEIAKAISNRSGSLAEQLMSAHIIAASQVYREGLLGR